jgi:hypothetical protein
MLRCMSPLLAQSGHTETICRLSAFGAKRTCRDRGWHIDPTRLTHSGHRPDQNSALQQPRPSNAYARFRTIQVCPKDLASTRLHSAA